MNEHLWEQRSKKWQEQNAKYLVEVWAILDQLATLISVNILSSWKEKPL